MSFSKLKKNKKQYLWHCATNHEVFLLLFTRELKDNFFICYCLMLPEVALKVAYELIHVKEKGALEGILTNRGMSAEQMGNYGFYSFHNNNCFVIFQMLSIHCPLDWLDCIRSVGLFWCVTLLYIVTLLHQRNLHIESNGNQSSWLNESLAFLHRIFCTKWMKMKHFSYFCGLDEMIIRILIS